MTVVMKMSRTEAAQRVARRTRAGTYSSAMIDAEELIGALEALGVIRFDEAAAGPGAGDRQ